MPQQWKTNEVGRFGLPASLTMAYLVDAPDSEGPDVIITIAVFIGLTIVAAAFALAPRQAVCRVIYDRVPDAPCAFGYKMAWLAIKTVDTKQVVKTLGLYRPESCNWRSGLGTVYHHELGAQRIFVSPPLEGWTLVAGLALPHPAGPRFIDKWTPMMTELAASFGDVQYYFSVPDIDYYAWARARKGKITRAFAIGDEGILLKRGRITRQEKALALKLFELRGVNGRMNDAGGAPVPYPTEKHVMQLAGQWSIDPTRLDRLQRRPGLGHIGFAPGKWRPKALRQAA